MPSVSQAVAFDIHSSISTHWARTLKTVAVIGYATESTVLGATTGASGFESSIGFVVVNEVFHLGFPFSAVLVDAVLGVHDSLLPRVAGHRL